MARRRRRPCGRRAKVAAKPAEDSPPDTDPTSLSSSPSGRSTDRATSQHKSPLSGFQPHQDDDDEAWTQSDKRAMRRRLLDIIHRFYLDAISRLPPTEFRRTTGLARGLFVGGHCFGPLHPVHNIVVNSIWYGAAFPVRRPAGSDDEDEANALLSTDGIARICHRSLDGLVAALRDLCPSLSNGDALWRLFSSGADLTAAVALANGVSKSSALRVVASQGHAAFHLAALVARHPDPTAFAHFASSALPSINGQHNIVQLLLMKHALATRHINYLSKVLVPSSPNAVAPLMLSAQVLDCIASQKQQFKGIGKQVLSVVNMALQEYTQRSGEQLTLHSVCGASLLKVEGLKNCYHINFLACHKGSGSAHLFTSDNSLTIHLSRLSRSILVPAMSSGNRTLATSAKSNAKILAVLYSGGKAAQEEPRLLGTTENKLGIADWLKEQGHEYIVTDDKEGPNSDFQKHLPDTEILITTPFHPGYLTADLMKKAPKLKLCVTAGVGSDHIDLNAANEHKLTVAEVSGSNVVSVAEHVLATILALVRNVVPAHQQISNDDWNVAEIARNSFDLEGKVVGTVGAGRIGYRVLQRLQGFDCKELLYFDYADIPADAAKKIKARRVEDLDEMLAQCDVVTINCPLHEKTKGLFDKERISKMKKGAWLVNTARGAICDADAVAEAVKSGHLNGYGGDVWNVQPAPKDHPWRQMANPLGGGNVMTAHYSGTTLDAQARYASGTKDILKRYFEGSEQDPVNVIVTGGQYASKAYGQREEKATGQREAGAGPGKGSE